MKLILEVEVILFVWVKPDTTLIELLIAEFFDEDENKNVKS